MTEDTQASPTNASSITQVGILLALAGCILFSVKPVLIKIAYQYGGDATSIMTLRAFSSLPLYLLMLLYLCRHRENRSKVKKFGLKAATIGVMGYYLASFLDIASLAFITAQLERLLIFLFPTFVVLISWVLYGQKPTRSVLVSALIGYLGISFIVVHDVNTFGQSVFVGSLLAVSSALVFAFYLVWSKPLIGQLGSSLFTSIGMGSAGLAILVHLSLSESDISTWSQQLVTTGIVLGIFCTVLPSYLVAAAMARLTPTTLSLTSNIGPAITAGVAVIVLDEVFTAWHAIGLILVVLSVYTLNRK
ncbi:permease of the drug/metabolite transporter (DMT) superfamily [Vibrio galatheae]|uniref:Permease of the drug/metabolite transporter (DMT) superfamily n=1 Tax=Vibrio galatheae TaxID=579748 RepID=A0A0F4NP34_9VIBR|nr:DMT family transporter [Vibrio galatheae]KJY84593.1 permease of the drug/metabolite transporter (DMT) superfamily [Vibrio galatheae]